MTIKYPATGLARVAAALLLLSSVALAQSSTDTIDTTAARKVTLKLTRVLMELPPGTPYVAARTGLSCLLDTAVTRFPGGRVAVTPHPYTDAFKVEVERQGFKAADTDALFDQEETGSADYQVAAVITDAHIVACISDGGLLHPGKEGDARGTASMKVDWQVYSPLRKEIVARISTSGDVTVEKTVPDGFTQLVSGAFASNARELIANPQFRTAMNSKLLTADDVLASGRQSRLGLPGSRNAVKRPIADTAGSIVTVETSTGSGSGVLLSDDGYIITNAHVVGDEKELRIRWSDKIEGVGQVLRVNKTRDVALIKANPRGRSPVPMELGALTPGQRVYAIGSPAGKDFEGTVSSGVVSASRTMNGLRYIQSDVMVSPGSSGGALLDEKGSLLGITEGGFDNEGKNAGLNIFIPIGDAMDFLNLEQN